MSLHRLQVFGEVAKQLSITKAAEILRISQPAASWQIKTLEDELNDPLIRRSGRGISLTAKGQALYRDIEPVLSHLARVEEKYFRPNRGDQRSARLFVGGGSGVAVSLLPMLIAKLAQSHAGAWIRLVESKKEGDIEDRIVKGLVDVGVVTNPIRHETLEVEPFRSEKLVAFASAKHVLSKQGLVSMADLERVSIVGRLDQDGENRTEVFLSRAADKKVRWNNAIGAESMASLKALVAKGAGIGISYQDAIAGELRSGTFKKLRFPIDLTVHEFIVYSQERPLSALANEFLGMLHGCARGASAEGGG